MKKQTVLGVGIGIAVSLLLSILMHLKVRQPKFVRRDVTVLHVKTIKTPEKMVMVRHCSWCETPVSVSELESKRRVALAKVDRLNSSRQWWADSSVSDKEFALQLWRNGLHSTNTGRQSFHSVSGNCICGHVHNGPLVVPEYPVTVPQNRTVPVSKPSNSRSSPSSTGKPEVITL